MRKVIIGAMVSLDGVMQAPSSPHEDPSMGFKHGGWVTPLGDDVVGEEIVKMLSEPYDLLLGRKTYDIFAAYWPNARDGAIARAFNSCTKYVATRKGVDLTWKDSVALSDAASDVAKLKREEGPPLLTQGSTDLIQTLLEDDLVDQINIFMFPVVLGKGKKLFGAGTKATAFRQIAGSVSPNGIIIAKYIRDGAVKTGDLGEKIEREG